VTSLSPASTPIAVLLNANARLVTEKVRRNLAKIVPSANLFLSQTPEEAHACVKEIIDNRYEVVFSGGGDGSFIHLLNLARDYVRERNVEVQKAGSGDLYELPQFGILKLGTGNGISTFVGSRGGTKLLERALHSQALSTLEMNLIEMGDRVFHFAGSGFDARVISDYRLFMNSLPSPAARKNFSGLVGYFCSGLGKTVPESLLKPDRGEVRIEAELADEAYLVKHARGIDEAVAAEKTLLYEGPSTIVGVATEPFYGYNIRAFPFARMKAGYMNLRILRAKPMTLVTQMQQFWNGSYRGTGVIDYLVKKVKITYEKSTPLQIGGDFESFTNAISYSIFPQALRLVDFRHMIG
jgi:diacylglycerol kinase family enzyme